MVHLRDARRKREVDKKNSVNQPKLHIRKEGDKDVDIKEKAK